MNIGSNIKKFRKKLGLQANKLAEQLGISPSYLNLIESGKRNIDGDLLIKICNELRIELTAQGGTPKNKFGNDEEVNEEE